MEGGRVRLRGRARDVLADPEIADLYLGGTTKRPDAPSVSERSPR